MFTMYFRMFLALLTLIFAYIALIYFIPISGDKIDEITGKTWNTSITQYVDTILWKVQDAQNTLENKLDNPAPNTSENIKGRIWQ